MKGSMTIAAFLLVAGVAPGLQAQASLDVDDLRAMVLEGFEKARAMDLAFTMAIPDSALRWAPTSGVRTFTEQVAHAGIGNTLFVAGPVLGETRPEAGDSAAYLNDKDALAAALNRAYDYVIAGVESLPDEAFFEETTLFGQQMPKWRVLVQALTHGIWTRGQLVPYFRMNGVAPPSYQAF